MEKYTFEQITNEKIREYNELDNNALELENLIEVVNADYKMGFVRYSDFYDRKLHIYYAYTNELKNMMHKLYVVSRFGDIKTMRYIRPANVITIGSEADIKSEYKDSKGNTALIIKDVDKFKEKYNAAFDNETYKYIHNLDLDHYWIENDKALRMNKIKLEIGPSILTFMHIGKEVNFELCANKFVTLSGPRGTANEIIDAFRYAEFDADCFDDYTRKNIKENKYDNMYFTFDDKYKQKQYHPSLLGCTEEQFEITQKELVNELVLRKVPRG